LPINLFLSDNSLKKLLFILEKKVFLAKEYLLHLINKCSSSSTASQLHCLHILFSTVVFGIVLQMTKECIAKLIRFWFEVDYSFTIMSYDGLVYTIPKTTVENRICKQCNCEAVIEHKYIQLLIW
jgi:hypothetical protein